MLRAALTESRRFELEPAREADPAVIARAHDPAYVRAFIDGTLEPQVMRRIGFPWSEALVRRTLASVGGTLSASRDALATGFGGNLAGGTHHAFRSEGAGFCVFNDLAVAILSLGLRAAVLDLDVHQGDGTAAIFEGHSDVLTVSLHGANNFPFHKRRGAIDVALPDGTEDDRYLAEVERVLPAIEEFHPAVLFYQSGVDGLSTDRLGRLALTHAGLEERDRMVFEFTHRLDVPVVVTLGGGYSQPIERTVLAHTTTFLTAARIYPAVQPLGPVERLSE
jgi:acetoin utilization deacetylase AcuC-like enzyme